MILCPKKGPLPAANWKGLEENPLACAGMVTSLTEEHDYQAEVEGDLPLSLRGTLYRNGPGLYDRGAERKRMTLDGDGMIQSFCFEEGRVRYRNRFVRTEKFQAEEKAGRFLFPTWSTLSGVGQRANLGGKIANQAGITVLRRGDQLLAFDEGHPPYRLDARTLETGGVAIIDPKYPARGYLAHWKLDPISGHWMSLSLDYGRRTVAHFTELDKVGVQRRHRAELPRSVYLHDWFVTQTYYILVLHPAYVNLGGYLKVLAGLDTYSEILRWRPSDGNLIAIIPRSAGFNACYFEAEACWMWHAANAFEDRGTIVADFVGSGESTGVATPLFELMQGKEPQLPEKPVSLVRRYVMEPASGRMTFQTFHTPGNCEMPFVSQRQRCQVHRYLYVAESNPGQLFWSSVLRVRAADGVIDKFHFPEAYCGEPVFVPTGGAPDGDAGVVLTQLYSPRTRKSSLAVLDAQHLEDGPIATVKLRHHVPISFHGFWHDAGS